MDRTSSSPFAQLATARVPAPRDGADVERRSLVRPERDFGLGYGRSSGYAEAQRRYVPAFDSERFRVH